ncbi:uncharacterized protein LOC123923974 [Trifolium pratense]|uniref:uncharacterized protein LOC123923974 n=1 Tax=Trifolium pratense TaxID=57577 RepID=UPI001E695E1A|nr:uncharacterized protein LOC123923974 [Trifolium pratense]
MKTKHFIFMYFYALLFIFVVAIEPYEDGEKTGEIEESKTDNTVNLYEFWPDESGNKKNGDCTGEKVTRFPSGGREGYGGKVTLIPGGAKVIPYPGDGDQNGKKGDCGKGAGVESKRQ